jgi:Domain of unknown function (DUF4184)
VPFTGSHPAAVLPFFRVLVPSALVIGSMVPDLPYYVPSPVPASVTHSAAGSWFDLLTGVIAFVWWQAALAPVARSAAPTGIRARLAPARTLRSFRSPRQGILVLVSICVGIVTHIVWDEFTHGGRWGARHITWLATTHRGLSGYEWAQYASGLAGILVLLLATARWWTTTAPTESHGPALRHARRLWLSIAAAAGIGVVAGFAIAHARGAAFHPAMFAAARVGGGAGLLVILVTATVISSRRRPGPLA